MDDRLLSAREAMAYLGVRRSFLTEHRVELHGIKVGSLLKFRRSGLDAYIARRQLGAPAQDAPKQPTRPVRRGRIADLYPPGTINPVTKRPFSETA